MFTRRFKALLLITLLSGLLRAQEEMYGVRVYVDDATVSAETTLNFILNLPTASIDNNDILVITLPQSEDTSDESGCNFVAGRSFCNIQSPLSVKKCTIESLYEATIKFKYTGSSDVNSLEGSVRYFKNPDSAQPVKNIQFTLTDEGGAVKAVYSSGEINYFQATTLDAVLSSSSDIVGDTGATLTVAITPSYILAASGTIAITIPVYYTSAGSDYMISTSSPTCTAQSTITVTSCTFVISSRQIEIEYEFKNGARSKQTATFYIENCFKNPITPETKSGFIVQSFDADEFIIGESETLSLGGIETPNTFQYVTFNFEQGTNVVGELNSFQMIIGMNLPLDDQCYIKFVFPEQFVLDENLYEAKGNSYFTNVGISSGTVPFYSIDKKAREIIVVGCEVYHGADQVGTITFNQVTNPTYVAETSSFQIILAKDSDFQIIIAEQTTGLTIPSSSWEAGSITSASVAAVNYMVSAKTTYIFSMVPSTSIEASQGSKIVITFTSLVDLSSSCTLSQINQYMYQSTQCSTSGTVITLTNTYRNIDFEGGNTVSFRISTITNPISVRDIGDITIQTYVQIGSTYYLVDSVTLEDQITTTPGEVTALAQTDVSSYITYDDEGVYIFKMSFEHTIPVGSSIQCTLPDGMEVFSTTKLQTNCYRLDYNSTPQKMKCSVSSDKESFKVSVTSSLFGSSGLQAGEEFRLQVVSVKNPRTISRVNMFEFESLDSLGYQIDVSTYDSFWTVAMSEISQMQLISAGMTNSTNGAETDYTLSFQPNTPLLDGDKLKLTFPTELTLPSQSYITCSGSSSIFKISCEKSTYNKVLVTFGNVGTIAAGQTFRIIFEEIVNAASQRPTSSFSEFLLTDSSNYGISTYDGEVSVTNNYVSYIQTYELVQDTQEPDVEAQYTIKFTTNNDLPYDTAIIVKMPSEVSVVRDKYRCFVLTSSKRGNVCKFEDNNIIKITNAFGDQPSTYGGTVEITFTALNPSSNADTAITLQMTLYDDSMFQYKIDQILTGLNPTFSCNYPCETCAGTNSNKCETCPVGKYEPQYLQSDGLGGATCKTTCDDGFTYNYLSASKVCLPCDSSCKTCRSGGGALDTEYCLTCADDYPVHWPQGNKCYPVLSGCPKGTHQSNTLTCTSCQQPCLECTSSDECSYCDPFSKRPLLQNVVCQEKCYYGFTPTYTGEDKKGICEPCKRPCATCYDGLPEKCKTCALGAKQFQFGSQCLAECPKGTAIDLESKKCTGCPEGCNECSPKDNSMCLTCKDGLAMLRSECFVECPPDYQKSHDGLTCETRIYPLNKFYAPFPFTCLLTLFFLVIITSWIITKKATLLCQNMIAATSLVMFVCVLFQNFLAMREGQPLIIVSCIIILLANLIVNVAYLVTFKFQIDDYRFNQYIKYHKYPSKVLTMLSLVVSMHMFRLVYGKLFALPIFHAATTSPATFYRPLMLYSLIQITCVAAPVLLCNIYFAAATQSRNVFDNQLQCTNIELILISTMLIGLVLYERYFQHPRFINFRPDHDAINVFQSVFGSNKKPEDSAGGQGEEGQGGDGSGKKNQDLLSETNRIAGTVQDKLDRHKLLRQLLGVVRSNKDTNLNVNLDTIMNEEIRPMIDKQDSQPSPRLQPIRTENSQEEPDPINYSWDGARPEWEGDGTDKRLKLLAWMELQMQQAAEKERLAFERAQRKQRFQEKESMYDNQMFDNVFFSAKSRRDNEVQPSIQFMEMGAQYSDMSAVGIGQLASETSDGERERRERIRLDRKKQKQKMKLDRQRVKEVQTSEVEFKDITSMMSSARSKTLQAMSSEVSSEVSSDSQVPGKQKSTIKESVKSYSKSSRKAEPKKSTKTAPIKVNADNPDEDEDEYGQEKADIVVASQESSKPSAKESVKEQEPRSTARSVKSNKSNKSDKDIASPDDVSVKLSDTGKPHKKLASQKAVIQKKKSKKVVQPVPRKQNHSHDPSMDSILGDANESRLMSETRTLQSFKEKRDINKIDHTTPGPETKKWIKRVKLMKTLMLDCRDPAHNPRNRHIMVQDGGSNTERTVGGSAQEHLQEINIVEDLIEKSEDEYMKGDSGSTLGDDWYRGENKDEGNGWQKDNIYVNQRNFNIFSVLGNFPLDDHGRIINRKQVLEEMDYKDYDGLPVNERGYLINETTGAIYSKFTFEDLFMPITTSVEDYGELPMPYRLERFNFSPHAIIGNFDYDVKTKKPIFLKNKFGQLTDKNYRPVNQSAFLINQQEDIIDNDGAVKFMHTMLALNGDLPQLYNYQGQRYKINEVLGQLRKDSTSKDILPQISKESRAVDELKRPVNANGYLIDERGNIINQKGEVIWYFWELLHQEPPKIFKFTQWTLDWIRGNVDPKVVLHFDPCQDFLFDKDNRLINTEGYLIDRGENIIDYYGRIVFKNELLNCTRGQDATIPKVFTRNVLTKPQVDQPDVLTTLQQSSRDNTSMGVSAMGKFIGKTRGTAASIFNLHETDSNISRGGLQPQQSDSNASHPKKLKKRKTTKLQRQNSHATSEATGTRHGTKVLNLYQQYLDGQDTSALPRKQFTSLMQAETTSGNVIKPILVTPVGMHHRGDYSSSSAARIMPNYLEENPTQPIHVNPIMRSSSNQRNKQSYHTAGGQGHMGRSASAARAIVPKIRMNQYMRDKDQPSPIVPLPRQGGHYIPDNSYAARAESIFGNTRGILSREEDPDLFGQFTTNNTPNLKNRNDSRANLSQQIDNVHNLYGGTTKKKRM